VICVYVFQAGELIEKLGTKVVQNIKKDYGENVDVTALWNATMDTVLYNILLACFNTLEITLGLQIVSQITLSFLYACVLERLSSFVNRIVLI
jgi:hypothetical protein